MKPIGEGLTLAIKSQGSGHGWDISMFKHDFDYIYPIQVPIRFNPTQFISPAYGQTLQDQTGNRTMKFLWKDDDYDRISTLESDVLWPYQAKDPDKARDDYLRAIKDASVGELRLKMLRFKADKDRLIAIDYDGEIVVPRAFQTLMPTHAAACPVEKI